MSSNSAGSPRGNAPKGGHRDEEEEEPGNHSKPDDQSGSQHSSSEPSSSLSEESDSSGLSDLPSNARHLVLGLMQEEIPPRAVFDHLIPSFRVPPDANDMTLWRLLASMIEPPRRKKLAQYNTIEDAVNLIRDSKNILVLSGAGISTSAGLPDFRSRDGIYVQIHQEHPDLHDPKLMFDIHYFKRNPLPFYRFARALYPGQYKPTIGHNFIKCIEKHGKLLRNYSQNIDTLEKQAGIERVVECHGSFATASCTTCNYKVDGEVIKEEVLAQTVPRCPKCCVPAELNNGQGLMKPNIVFFGEQLGDNFHSSLDADKKHVDLLIVIGSSLKVRPVALIPNSISDKVPQILINKEPLDHMDFDIELLGNCDDIIQELCLRLGNDWTKICAPDTIKLQERTEKPEIMKAIDNIQASPPNKPAATAAISSKEEDADEKDDVSMASVQDDKCDGSNSIQPSSVGTSSQPSTGDQASQPRVNSNESETGDGAISDHSSEWEDIEEIDSSELPHLRNRIDLDIPDRSFIFVKPCTYFFRGAELNQSQYKNYTKDLSEPSKTDHNQLPEQ